MVPEEINIKIDRTYFAEKSLQIDEAFMCLTKFLIYITASQIRINN